MKIVSLFSGIGGLDLGFKKSGFKLVFANDIDKKVKDTFEKNFNDTEIVIKDIRQIDKKEIPDCVGIIGGPPCQSWSVGGARRGINDIRGQLFFDYIKMIEIKKPLFFVAENVSGILNKRNSLDFKKILESFESIGYKVFFSLLNAKNYNVPQDRKRVFIVGFLNKKINFKFPLSSHNIINLQQTIFDIKDNAVPFKKDHLDKFNHEFYDGNFSSIYMSRNRVKNWHDQSFTIQACARHIPIHPSAPKMVKVGKDEMIFDVEKKDLYRRLSVRECARIQTFPDNFIFYYNNIFDGYRMVGNAVPVNLSYAIAKEVLEYL